MRLARLLGYDFVKRAFDVLAAGTALLLLAPVIGIVWALVAFNLGRPVVFRQPRPGMHGRVFTLYKFRTMREVDPSRGLLTDDERLTPFGRWLRSSSLDELPTFWNVVRGDMSLIGPRPLLVEYLEHYSPEQARRHEVRPGITGLAQVNGRNALSWDEKFRLDVVYIDSRSPAVDLRILRQTARSVIAREGISHPGQATMHRFGDVDVH